MITEFYYSWVITPQNCPSDVLDLVNIIIKVLYQSYPHTIDLHLQVLVEVSVSENEIKLIEFDFSRNINQEEVQDLLLKGFLKVFDKKTLSYISKVIVLGYTEVNPFDLA